MRLPVCCKIVEPTARKTNWVLSEEVSEVYQAGWQDGLSPAETALRTMFHCTCPRLNPVRWSYTHAEVCRRSLVGPGRSSSMLRGALPVLLGLTLFSGALCADRTMMTQYGVGSYDSLAVCNDNSTYNYFFRPGVGGATNT